MKPWHLTVKEREAAPRGRVETVREKEEVGGGTIKIGTVPGHVPVVLKVDDMRRAGVESGEQPLDHGVWMGRSPKARIDVDRNIGSFQCLEKNTCSYNTLLA